MKINVVARRYVDVFESLVFSHSVKFEVLDYPRFSAIPDILILYEPSPIELMCDYNMLIKLNPKAKFIVFASSQNKAVYSAFLPYACILDSKETYELEKVIQDVHKSDCSFDRLSFSALEKSFLSALSSGLNAQEIGERLELTDRSVRRVKEKLLKKTNLFSIQQLLIFSIMDEYINIHSC